ncbi:hypothetical protein MBM09_10720 [Flaviramulus sp. BrNp1-15]|uniref:hypothetical protein n=1 Tax=Flaviramulus sp. BrNp1-15 TaxID=2916754 RepID=UPI001EE81496|nr:hypothetical protein [Flaviramulus sp. BrNp1-15]ULC58394.1 hypothetical protein MBM09_10720 [Flaviramulus sp. BrNp1-15]
MNFPSLPTDNLYKFISIFGLTILVFSQIWKFQVDKEAFRLGSSIISDEAELSIIKSDMISTDSFIEKRKRIYQREEKDSISVDSTFLNKLLEDKKRLEYEKAELANKYNEKVTEANRNLEDFSGWMKLTNRGWLFIVMNLTGTILFFSGMIFWYFKYQRYMDAEKKLEGDKFLKKLKRQNKTDDKK